MKNIRMTIVVRFPDKGYDLDNMMVMWNAFEFIYPRTINDIILPFDFDAWADTFERKDGYIYIKAISGTGEYFSDYSISKDYIEDIYKAGVDPESLDAEFMSKTIGIAEFGCDIYVNIPEKSNESEGTLLEPPYILDTIQKPIPSYPLDDIPEIVSIAFLGDSMVPLYVNKSVIEKYNNKYM